ncbi:hypothetical protein, partial [Psychrobacter sp.]|uniref:hypothetical protein n=1 Tax=Psychrobacter sp. TaxID=56811 RepID=UPI0025CFDCED
MRVGIKTIMLTSLVIITALLSACSITSYNQVMSEPIDKVAEQSKLRIDWTTIDAHSGVPKDNSPRDIEYPNITKQMAKASNIPVADIYRFQTVYDSKKASEVIDKIKAQLGHSYVDLYV